MPSWETLWYVCQEGDNVLGLSALVCELGPQPGWFLFCSHRLLMAESLIAVLTQQWGGAVTMSSFQVASRLQPRHSGRVTLVRSL